MFPPQNPDLLERLMNYELSLLKNMLKNRLNVGVNLFHIVGDNMIQTVLYNGKPLNINTGKVKNSGMEFSVTAGFATICKSGGNTILPLFARKPSVNKVAYKLMPLAHAKLHRQRQRRGDLIQCVHKATQVIIDRLMVA